MKKALFIYNPNAGKGLLKPKLSDIIDIIVKAGYEVVVYPTQNDEERKKDSGRLHPDRNDQRLCEQSPYPEESSPGGKYSCRGKRISL